MAKEMALSILIMKYLNLLAYAYDIFAFPFKSARTYFECSISHCTNPRFWSLLPFYFTFPKTVHFEKSYINPLAPELFFFNFSTPIYKM